MANFFKERRDALSAARGKYVSQHRIAVALDVTPGLVGMWERGELAPNLKLAAPLAEVYEVTQEQIEDAIVALTREITAREEREREAAPATPVK
jgi:transcriptional regulator with XRE-family HTH domain